MPRAVLTVVRNEVKTVAAGAVPVAVKRTLAVQAAARKRLDDYNSVTPIQHASPCVTAIQQLLLHYNYMHCTRYSMTTVLLHDIMLLLHNMCYSYTSTPSSTWRLLLLLHTRTFTFVRHLHWPSSRLHYAVLQLLFFNNFNHFSFNYIIFHVTFTFTFTLEFLVGSFISLLSGQGRAMSVRWWVYRSVLYIYCIRLVRDWDFPVYLALKCYLVLVGPRNGGPRSR